MSISTFAQVIQVAYASLQSGMSADDLSNALRLPEDGSVETQATNSPPVSPWVLQYNDDAPGFIGNSTGLSFTVFQNTATQQLTLAIRGA